MKRLSLLPMLVCLAGCSSITARDYTGDGPRMDMIGYFSGSVHAWGVVQDRSGKVIRRFTLVMQGTPQADGSLTIHEVLDYVGGDHQTRDWKVQPVDEHHVDATANGIVGIAHGEQYGDALHLEYVLQDSSSGSLREFPVDDWFFLQADGVLINRSYGSKWGIHVFDVITSFQKAPASP